MSKSPTCPVCSDPVSEVVQDPDGTHLRPCGHTVSGDEWGSWRNEGTVEYVPEDVAAREAIDQAAVSQDGLLQELLAYCRSEARSPNPDWAAAYDDVATRLRSILDA
jgi:hypothetical protein